MAFRPTAEHRKNVNGVIYPLTAAVRQVFGMRSDGAYPIGTFYTVNIDNFIWQPVDGIWYRPFDSESIEQRSIREEDIERFVAGITTGEETVLRSGIRVTWERVPSEEAAQLPSRSGVE